MISLGEFDGIYNKHVDNVFRVALRAVSRREIAEEITSEVFLTLFQSAEGVTTDQIPAWLFTVAKRRAADYTPSIRALASPRRRARILPPR